MLQQTDKLKGVIPPIVTPLTKERSIDARSTQKLIQHVIGEGVSAVFILGSVGECPTLEEGERIKLMEIAVEAVGESTPILSGIDAISTEKAINMVNIAEKKGIDVAVVPPPYYFPLDEKSITNHYQEILEKTNIPLIIYNIPQTTGNKVTVGIIEKISPYEKVLGVKDSSGDLSYFQQLLSYRGEKFRIFQGWESLLAASLFMGADGTMPGSANVGPKLHVELYRKFLEKKYEKVNQLQRSICDFTEIYFNISSIVGALKVALSYLGLCKPIATKPLPVPIGDKRKLIQEKLQKFLSEVNEGAWDTN